MEGWEIPLAAFGGLLLGLGLGITWVGRRERTARRELTRCRARLRSTVIPVLERRAEALGVPPERRSAADGRDTFELAGELAQAIEGVEDGHTLPFSDTLEIPSSHGGKGDRT